MNLLNVKDCVMQLLIKSERCRNSDTRLTAAIWKHHIKEDLPKLQAIDLLQLLADNKLPSYESISRVRRKLQEKYPALRGDAYNARKAEEENVKQQIKKI